MRNFVKKFFAFFFCLSISFFVFSESAIDEIYRRCGIIETSCADIVRVTSSAINKIENQTYTYNEYVNGSNVTTTVRLKEIGGFGHTVDELQRIYNNAVDISNQSGLIRQLATQLSNGGGGGSYDDTDLLAALDELEKRLDWISEDTVKINDNLDTLNYYLEHEMSPFLENIGSYTNNLDSIFTSITNFYFGHIKSPFGTIKYDSNRFGSPIWYAVRDNSNSPMRFTGLNYILTIPGYRDTYHNLFEVLATGILNQQYNLGSLNNYAFTNLMQNISFQRDILKDFKSYSNFTTNKIHEIVSIFNTTSPLERITEDSNPSNIYNFVTNYYIKVSTNPSGSADENHTNWFNRVEMLLAALVFRPEETVVSNKFDNATDSESQAFSDSLKSVLEGDISEIQGNSQNVLQDFEKTKTSLLNFFGHLDDKLSSLASIPSHIEFFEITTSSGDTKKVEIATQGVFASYADTLRAISTLCWVSFFVYVIFVLSRWLFVKFSTILKFCYSVFKTLIGIG